MIFGDKGFVAVHYIDENTLAYTKYSTSNIEKKEDTRPILPKIEEPLFLPPSVPQFIDVQENPFLPPAIPKIEYVFSSPPLLPELSKIEENTPEKEEGLFENMARVIGSSVRAVAYAGEWSEVYIEAGTEYTTAGMGALTHEKRREHLESLFAIGRIKKNRRNFPEVLVSIIGSKRTEDVPILEQCLDLSFDDVLAKIEKKQRDKKKTYDAEELAEINSYVQESADFICDKLGESRKSFREASDSYYPIAFVHKKGGNLEFYTLKDDDNELKNRLEQNIPNLDVLRNMSCCPDCAFLDILEIVSIKESIPYVRRIEITGINGKKVCYVQQKKKDESAGFWLIPASNWNIGYSGKNLENFDRDLVNILNNPIDENVIRNINGNFLESPYFNERFR